MNEFEISPQQEKILKYLRKFPGCCVIPTEIGREVGGYGKHSSWACPKLKKLVCLGLAARNGKGYYKAEEI